MQKANVSHGKTKMDKRELLCVRRSRVVHRGQVVHCAGLMSIERKKVMRKQKRGKEKD
jgi:hypothetical protein